MIKHEPGPMQLVLLEGKLIFCSPRDAIGTTWGSGDILYASLYFLQHLAKSEGLDQYRFQKGTICDGVISFHTLLSVHAPGPNPCVFTYVN